MLPFELTKDTPYLALSGELWSVYYEFFNRNWSCYKGFLLYYWGNLADTTDHGHEWLAVNWIFVIFVAQSKEHPINESHMETSKG